MFTRKTHLALAAAAAAVSFGFAGASFAGGDDCASCDSTKTQGQFITADDPQAGQAATAEELLAKYNAVELPRPDMSRREDAAYVKEFQARQREAMTEKAKIGREFVMAHPTHEQAGKVFKETMQARVFLLNEGDQVRQDVEKLLANDELPAEFRKTLDFAQVDLAMMVSPKPGEERESFEARRSQAADEAWTKVQQLRDKYENDPQLARLMGQVADASQGEEQIERLEATLAAFPDSPATKYTKGKLRQVQAVGKPFEISFTDAVSGEKITSEDLKGKVVVVDFWATWCGPCIAEMPKMKELYAKYKDQGVEFVGISLDQPEDKGGKEALLKYCKENEITWPQYYQGAFWDGEFSRSWGINSIPAVFLIDADGNLYSTEARGRALEVHIPELIAKRDGAQAAAKIGTNGGDN